MALPMGQEKVTQQVEGQAQAVTYPYIKLIRVNGGYKLQLHHDKVGITGIASPIDIGWRPMGGNIMFEGCGDLRTILNLEDGAMALAGAERIYPLNVGVNTLNLGTKLKPVIEKLEAEYKTKLEAAIAAATTPKPKRKYVRKAKVAVAALVTPAIAPAVEDEYEDDVIVLTEV